MAKTPTVLIVETQDAAFNTGAFESLLLFIKSQVADHKIVTVRSKSSNVDKANKEIKKQLAEKITEDDEITHFYLGAHGSTEQFVDGYTTSLGAIGDISETEVDDYFTETFASIKDHFSSQATIVLNSCSTFCGTEESVMNRALVLAKFFHIKDGTVYGSIVPEYGGIPSLRHSFRPKLLMISTLGVAFLIFMPAYLGEIPISQYLGITTLAAAFMTPAISLFHYMVEKWRVSGNKGRLVTISDSEPASIELVKKIKSALKVFGFRKNSCDSNLE